MDKVTDADFREFVKAVQDLALQAYPNPDRIGCPNKEVLHEIARQSRPSAHPVFQSHIVECSPCIAAMLAERTRIQARQRVRRRLLVAAAGCVCIVALLSNSWLWHRSGPSTSDQLASTPGVTEIPIDLRPYSPTRSDTGQRAKPPIAVPRQRVRLKLFLAPGSPLGPYEIRILTKDRRILRSQQALALLNDRVTSIIVSVTLSDLKPDAYLLLIRPASDGEEWQTYPVVLGGSR